MAEQPIRDAATLVIVDRSAGEPRVLMGRRRPDLLFLPNVFVFPGGRVDEADADAPSADELLPDEAALLRLSRDGHAPYSASLVRSLPLAAVRECFEETGIAAGTHASAASAAASSGIWAPFVGLGILPKLSTLRFFARAITPRARPRRYDTRFFLLDAGEIVRRGAPVDEELSEIGWFTLGALPELQMLGITKIVIGEVANVLANGLPVAGERSVPFFFEQNDVKQRAELSLASARS